MKRLVEKIVKHLKTRQEFLHLFPRNSPATPKYIPVLTKYIERLQTIESSNVIDYLLFKLEKKITLHSGVRGFLRSPEAELCREILDIFYRFYEDINISQRFNIKKILNKYFENIRDLVCDHFDEFNEKLKIRKLSIDGLNYNQIDKWLK